MHSFVLCSHGITRALLRAIKSNATPESLNGGRKEGYASAASCTTLAWGIELGLGWARNIWHLKKRRREADCYRSIVVALTVEKMERRGNVLTDWVRDSLESWMLSTSINFIGYISTLWVYCIEIKGDNCFPKQANCVYFTQEYWTFQSIPIMAVRHWF